MRKHNFTTLFLGAILLALPLGCGDAQVAQKAAVDLKAASAPKADPAAAKPAPPKSAAKVEPADADNEPAPLTVPAGYNYRAGSRRDPFVNPIPKPVNPDKPSEKAIVRPEGLPGVFVSEVKISGIIHSADPAMRKAMLATGRRTYFVAQGDVLYDGMIKEIRPTEIVFSMVSITTKEPTNREVIVSAGGSSATLSGEKK